MNDFLVSNRSVNENIGIHRQVDNSVSPFTRLLKHIQLRTQFYNGFCNPLIICYKIDLETT